MKVVVVASGEPLETDAAWLGGADLVIAADGGAAWLERMGRDPDRLIGDLDSTDAATVDRLAARGARIERHPPDKDASDTELALDAARHAGATSIVLLGAFGGQRLDHEVANLLLLADPDLAGLDVRAVRAGTVVRALHGPAACAIDGALGDLVSLLPLGGDALGVSTEGLRWPLERATLAMGGSRGLSNVVDHLPASVSLDAGALLVIQTPNQGATTP
ncbi:MAG TPA: thiamine diphosphokinase [Candidatus Limnocylindria bacterium]|nr:thiamine diphosphokinase [Candidatus Limnocylindria bacterium]